MQQANLLLNIIASLLSFVSILSLRLHNAYFYSVCTFIEGESLMSYTCDVL
jgi:hypothetical protein